AAGLSSNDKSTRCVVISTDEEARGQSRMAHRAEIEQRGEATDFVNSLIVGDHGCDNRRLQSPENLLSARLPERHQALACRDMTGKRLMQVSLDGRRFVEPEHAADEAEGGAVVYLAPDATRSARNIRKQPELF